MVSAEQPPIGYLESLISTARYKDTWDRGKGPDRNSEGANRVNRKALFHASTIAPPSNIV